MRQGIRNTPIFPWVLALVIAVGMLLTVLQRDYSPIVAVLITIATFLGSLVMGLRLYRYLERL